MRIEKIQQSINFASSLEGAKIFKPNTMTNDNLILERNFSGLFFIDPAEVKNDP